MGKVGITIVLASMVIALAPLAAAEEVCERNNVGSCVAAGADDGVYVCERASNNPTCAFFVFAGRERELEAGEAVEDQHAFVDVQESGAEASYERDGTRTFDELVAVEAGASGVAAQWRAQSADVGADGSRESHLCFVMDVDGTLAGVDCGDWLNGDVTPVFVDGTAQTIEDIRRDPVVNCVIRTIMRQTCIL